MAEAGPAFVEEGLITPAALETGIEAVKRAASDETVLAIMPSMAQVCAVTQRTVRAA